MHIVKTDQLKDRTDDARCKAHRNIWGHGDFVPKALYIGKLSLPADVIQFN